MRLLLAVCLCFTSTRQAFGDERPTPDPISVEPPVFEPIDDVNSLRRPPADSPRLLERANARLANREATEWLPRLLIMLRAADNVPQTNTVVPKNSLPNFNTLPSYPDSKNVFFPAPPSDLPESSEATVTVKAWSTSPGDFFSLYCDTVTVNILQEGTTPTYQLECKSRVHISTDGFSVDADSASLKDGKCELVNAKLNNGVVSATAVHLTLTLPIRGVSTTDFGRPIPKSQPTEKAVIPLPAKLDDSENNLPVSAVRSPQQPPSAAKTDDFNADGGVPEPNN